jgi:hypothetical protein
MEIADGSRGSGNQNPSVEDWLGEAGDVDWLWLPGPQENIKTTAAAPGRHARGREFSGYGQSKTPGTPRDLDDSQRSSARHGAAAILQRRGAVILFAVFALLAAAIAVPVIAFKGNGSQSRAFPAVTASAGRSDSQQVKVQGKSATRPAPVPVTVGAAAPPVASQSPLTVELPRGGLLRAGQTGTAVLRLQNVLAALGFEPGEPDGIFGNMTTAAVISFQKASGLDPDGVVGDETAKKLNVAVGAQGGVR